MNIPVGKHSPGGRMHESPDRPANWLEQKLGIRDIDPPITDQEHESYVRYRDAAAFAPAGVLDLLPPCPPKVTRNSRRAIRRLLAAPRFPVALELLEKARAQHLVDQARLVAEAEAERVRAEAEKHKSRLAQIDEFHANQLNEVRFTFNEFKHLIGDASLGEATRQMTLNSYDDDKRAVRADMLKGTDAKNNAAVVVDALFSMGTAISDNQKTASIRNELAKLIIRRSLVSMRPEERATLRMSDVLASMGLMDVNERLRIIVPIVWNDAQCDMDFGNTQTDFMVRNAMIATLKALMVANLPTSAGARERLNMAVRAALAPTSNIAGVQRETVERYLFSGNRWMTHLEGEKLTKDSPSALTLGRFPDTQTEYRYDLRESLITVAPPGSGKTQAHVLRNLLYLQSPAVVLDIKGEMLRDTRAWREANVGRTYAFNPQSPQESIHYNPVDDIRDDPELAWEDARSLADLLVIPSTSKSDESGYFESRARDMITTALLDVALSEQGADRSMSGVLDRLYVSEDEKVVDWCHHLEKLDNEQLKRQATALIGMPQKQREGVFDAARRALEIWQSPAISKISADTTFDATKFREENATLYLAVALEDIRKYASVLRVLIGQSLRKLYRVKPESDAKTITFFLDELPRLGRMDVIEESLDVGRGYGVRLWMFCQNTGQLRTTYPNAQGMMSNCAVR